MNLVTPGVTPVPAPRSGVGDGERFRRHARRVFPSPPSAVHSIIVAYSSCTVHSLDMISADTLAPAHIVTFLMSPNSSLPQPLQDRNDRTALQEGHI